MHKVNYIRNCIKILNFKPETKHKENLMAKFEICSIR